MCPFHANEFRYISFLLITEEHSIVWLRHSFFHQSFTDGPLCCFSALPLVNSVSVATLLCMPCISHIYLFSALLLEVVMLIKSYAYWTFLYLLSNCVSSWMSCHPSLPLLPHYWLPLQPLTLALSVSRMPCLWNIPNPVDHPLQWFPKTHG